MKNLLASFFTFVLTCSIYMTANAASIIVLPLVNNQAEEQSTTNQIYYDRTLEALKNQTKYELADGNEIDKIVAKHTQKDVVPTAEELRLIAQEANVDLIYVMEVKEISSKVDKHSHADNYVVTVKGTTFSYARATDKYVAHSVSNQVNKPTAFAARYDLQAQLFGNTVTQEINRVLQVKKITIQKQRISKL